MYNREGNALDHYRRRKGYYMPRYIVDTGKIELSKDRQMELNKKLQQTVLGYMAEHADFQHKPWSGTFPREWMGLLLDERLEALEQNHAQITKQLGAHR